MKKSLETLISRKSIKKIFFLLNIDVVHPVHLVQKQSATTTATANKKQEETLRNDS